MDPVPTRSCCTQKAPCLTRRAQPTFDIRRMVSASPVSPTTLCLTWARRLERKNVSLSCLSFPTDVDERLEGEEYLDINGLDQALEEFSAVGNPSVGILVIEAKSLEAKSYGELKKHIPQVVMEAYVWYVCL
jgi:hypothetical protein